MLFPLFCIIGRLGGMYMPDGLIMHVIECMKADAGQLKNEHDKTGTKDLKNLPSYERVKAYCDAVKALNRTDCGYKAYTMPKGVLKQTG